MSLKIINLETPTLGDRSYIAEEKRINPALLLEKERFIFQTFAALDSFPTYFKLMGAINCAGAGPIDISL